MTAWRPPPQHIPIGAPVPQPGRYGAPPPHPVGPPPPGYGPPPGPPGGPPMPMYPPMGPQPGGGGSPRAMMQGPPPPPPTMYVAPPVQAPPMMGGNQGIVASNSGSRGGGHYQQGPPPYNAPPILMPVDPLVEAVTAETLRSHVFFVLHFQLAAATQFVSACVPIELAMVAFTAYEERGFIHTLISPGTIPQELMASALWLTRRVHGIHHAATNMERNYSNAWSEITAFVTANKVKTPRQQLPLVFAKSPTVQQSCLEWLAKMANTEVASVFSSVCSVESLIEQSHKVLSTTPNSRLSVLTITDMFSPLLDINTDQRPGDRCSHHDQLGMSNFRCALSDCRRVARVCMQVIQQMMQQSQSSSPSAMSPSTQTPSSLGVNRTTSPFKT